jgi:hypothetical protein
MDTADVAPDRGQSNLYQRNAACLKARHSPVESIAARRHRQPGRLHRSGRGTMPFVTSGHGDGMYPAYTLIEGDTPVGVEVVFLGPEVDE